MRMMTSLVLTSLFVGKSASYALPVNRYPRRPCHYTNDYTVVSVKPKLTAEDFVYLMWLLIYGPGGGGTYENFERDARVIFLGFAKLGVIFGGLNKLPSFFCVY